MGQKTCMLLAVGRTIDAPSFIFWSTLIFFLFILVVFVVVVIAVVIDNWPCSLTKKI